MNKKHCINCVNCEPMEYTNKIGYTYECRQADILLTKQQMKEADKCQCYEEDITKGAVWEIPEKVNPTTLNEFYKVIDKLELENKRLKEELNNKNCSDCKNNITLDEDIVDDRILKMNIRMLKEEIKILKANNDHICTGKLPY